jgi:chaperonin GroEL
VEQKKMTKNEHDDAQPEVLFDDEARQKLLSGIEILARAVMTTLGPRGQNVVIERVGEQHFLTKDGVTVAKSINLRDPYMQMGCQLIREAAQRTNDVAGDGTTTATVLAHAIFSGGMKLIAAGHSGVELKRGIDIATASVIEELKKLAIRVDDDELIVNVGTISANGEREIGELLAEAMKSVGRDGVITVEDAKGLKTSLDVVEGARFDRGYLSSYFVTDPDRMVCELNDPLVLISNLRFSAAQGLIPLLEAINRKQKSLIIIADEVEGELLQLLVTNHMRGTLRCCAIKAPAFGEQRLDILNDIATITGGKLITSGDRFDTADKADALIRANVFGSCKKLVVDKLKTTFIGAMGSREEIEKRADLIRVQLSDPTIDAPVKAILKDRLSKLASGVAILRVGGSTESELKERKYRVEDALNATQAAVAEGIVPGGGVALIKASQVLNNDDFAKDMSLTQAEKLGVKLVLDACHAPLRRIVENAAATPAVIVENEVKKNSSPTFGYDASHDAYVDVLQAGIIDPVRVTRSALENASSISGLLLCVNALVLDTVERSAISSRS